MILLIGFLTIQKLWYCFLDLWYKIILQKESGSEKSVDGDPDHPGSGGPAGLGEDPLQYPHHPAPVYPGISQSIHYASHIIETGPTLIVCQILGLTLTSNNM